MPDIEWAEPPATRTGGRSPSWRDPIVESLKDRPGRWACVERAVWTSNMKAWQRRGCEATSRDSGIPGKRRVDIYARWPETRR